MRNDNRPTNVGLSNLLVFRFPITAIVSIMHRITGILLFAGIAFALYVLQVSLSSEQGFNEIKSALSSPLCLVISIALIAVLLFHFVAGIKHLLMDLGIGETLEGGVFASRVVLLSVAILVFLTGIWLVQV